MTRLKVVYVITGLYIGGAEKLLLNQLRCIDRRRIEPVVVTLAGGDMFEEFARAGVRVENVAIRGAFDLGGAFRLRAIIRREQPDVVHTHLFHADLLGRLVARWCGVPVILTTLHMQEAPQHRWWCDPISRALSRVNAAIFAVSDEVKRAYVANVGLRAERIEVLVNGVEPMAPVTAEERARVRRSVGVPEGGQLLGIVSRLEAPRKGHAVLFRALAQVLPRWPGLRCVVVGDGPARAELEAQAAALGLTDRIRFVGMQPRVDGWLAALDVYTLPSFEEGLPMALIEAMGAACPIITTPVGGIPGLIQDGRTGLLVPPGDADALARAIDRLLCAPEAARALGHAAHTLFEERYDMRRLITQLEARYAELAAPCIRLLEMVTTLDPGGVTTYLANLVRGLPSNRFRITVACGPDAFQADLARTLPARIDIIPGLQKAIHPLRDLAALWRLCRLIRRARVEMVHTNMSKVDLLGGLAAWLCRVPCIVSTCHGPLRVSREASTSQRVFDTLERLVYRAFPHRIISVSAFTASELIRKGKATPRQLVTIPNAIDAGRLARPQADGARARTRATLGLSSTQPVLIMVARLREPKTPDVLIESVRRLRAEWPELVCLFVGDGPQSEALEQQIARDGLVGAVRLLGRRDDVPDLLAASDAFVLSTYSEGMSVSVLEAMAAGLPVIASRVGGMEELVQSDRTGLLVPPHDAQALAAAIRRVLIDTALRRQMGTAAQARIAEEFSVERHVERTREALEQVWAARTAGASVDPSPIERLRRHLREEGLGATLSRVAGQALSRVYAAERYWLLRRPMDAAITSRAPRTACVVRRATIADVDRLSAVALCSRAELDHLLRSPHDACFIAERDGQVLAQQWVVVGPCGHDVSPLPWLVQLREGEAYFYGDRTLRPYRGQGLAGALTAELLRWVAARGVHSLFTLVRDRNAVAVRKNESVGFRVEERVAMRRTPLGVSVDVERLRDGRLTPASAQHWRPSADGPAWFAEHGVASASGSTSGPGPAAIVPAPVAVAAVAPSHPLADQIQVYG
jgi:glycosyltransferase involved in cell wall biosynthesis/GNAT superfamily N-acetyltransferase